MSKSYSAVSKIANQGYSLEFGTILENTFNNYKKIFGIAGLGMIIVGLILGVLIGGIIGVVYGFSDFVGTMTNLQPQFMSGNALLIFVLVVAFLGAFFSPINAGFIKMAHLAETNQDYGIQTIFDYYKGKHLKDLFLATFMLTLVTTGINSFLEFMGIFFIGALITYIVSFLAFLTVPLIIFADLNATQAITMSIKLVLKQPFILLGLLIVSIIFVCLGMIALCIGILFTIPFMYSMYYCIYKEIVPLVEDKELDQIGVNQEN